MSRAGKIAALALAGLTAACALRSTDRGDAPSGALRLSFEDRQEPGVFRAEGAGRREPPGSAAGLWAVVAGLPRPERALVENLDSGAQAAVALFRGGGSPTEVRLSTEAADALGIGDRPARVRVTALRSEPQVAMPRDGF